MSGTDALPVPLDTSSTTSPTDSPQPTDSSVTETPPSPTTDGISSPPSNTTIPPSSTDIPSTSEVSSTSSDVTESPTSTSETPTSESSTSESVTTTTDESTSSSFETSFTRTSFDESVQVTSTIASTSTVTLPNGGVSTVTYQVVVVPTKPPSTMSGAPAETDTATASLHTNAASPRYVSNQGSMAAFIALFGYIGAAVF
ncbi:hypothetical protein ABW19_dt0208452 [Dactylella cylindrospora]|nr:hypothetical protein ABW19_dt0208452 [Dactylella cylindrospora]